MPCIAWWPKTISDGHDDATPWSALDVFPTIANVAGCDADTPVRADPDRADKSVRITFDGQDMTALLKDKPTEPRMLFYYFGVQLQAVREGRWKLFVPVTKLPDLRVPSLWFEHQAGLFERQHRLWPKPTLYDLSGDLGEKTDVAAEHPEIVAKLLQKAQVFDDAFQRQIPAVQYLPGPKPPAPGQVRTASDNIDEWLKLTH